MTKKESKKAYFDRVYDNAEIIKCACGCGIDMKNKDRYGRDKKYINGHNGRKYEDPLEYKRAWYKRAKNDPEYVKRQQNLTTSRGHKLKAKLVETFGSKCCKCGYQYDGDNASCFDFHHENPEIKLFNVNAGAFNKYSLATVYEESRKCMMVCAICHRLIHNIVPY